MYPTIFNPSLKWKNIFRTRLVSHVKFHDEVLKPLSNGVDHSSPTWVGPKAKLVLSPLTANWKHVVLRVSSAACGVHQINPELVLCFCKAVNLVQSQPKLTIQITKAILVVGPAAVEIYRAILSFLKHYPTPTSCCLVTVYIKGTRAIRVDCINTAGCFTRFVQPCAGSCWLKIQNVKHLKVDW